VPGAWDVERAHEGHAEPVRKVPMGRRSVGSSRRTSAWQGRWTALAGENRAAQDTAGLGGVVAGGPAAVLATAVAGSRHLRRRGRRRHTCLTRGRWAPARCRPLHRPASPSDACSRMASACTTSRRGIPQPSSCASVGTAPWSGGFRVVPRGWPDYGVPRRPQRFSDDRACT
jgi:hypothetical protein